MLTRLCTHWKNTEHLQYHTRCVLEPFVNSNVETSTVQENNYIIHNNSNAQYSYCGKQCTVFKQLKKSFHVGLG